MSKDKFIDVERLLKSKNPKAAKWIPGFIVRYLKRIVHQKEINSFLEEHKDKKNEEFCQAVVDDFNLTIEVKNLERIPEHGKVVFAMNHPLGGMDAMILVTALKDKRKDLKFIVNDILMNLENLKDLFVGVNKIGRNSSSLREQIETLFESDQGICIFPAGLVSRKNKGEVKDLVWKKTFVKYAKKHGQDVVPIYIDGKLSKFFYRLANFRKFLGIKANIEMLYLANELFKQRNKTMRFVIGEPIPNNELFSEKSDYDKAQEIKEIVYELRKELGDGTNH
jgi:putative hemolysin